MLILSTIFFLAIPIISLPLFFVLMLINKSEKNYYVLFFSFSLGIVAFYIEPIQALDLYRYFEQMDVMGQLNFIEFFNTHVLRPEFLSNLTFFIIAKIKQYGLLSMIATTISYYFIIKCVLECANKKNLRLLEKIVILLFVLSIMIFTHFATRIRNNVGLVLCAYAFYREYVQGKKGLFTKMLYILPCFIHASMLLGVIIRLVLCIKEKYLKVILPIIVGLVVILGNMYITMIGGFMSNFGMFSSYDDKISAYILSGTEYEPTNVKVKFALMLLLLCNVIHMIKRYNYGKENSEYTKMILVVDLIVMSLVQYNDVFLRFFYLAFFVNIKLLIDTVRILSRKEEKIIYYALIILFTFAHVKLQYSAMQDLRFPELANNVIINMFQFSWRIIA